MIKDKIKEAKELVDCIELVSELGMELEVAPFPDFPVNIENQYSYGFILAKPDSETSVFTELRLLRAFLNGYKEAVTKFECEKQEIEFIENDYRA